MSDAIKDLRNQLSNFRDLVQLQIDKETKALNEKFNEDNMKKLLEAAKRLDDVNSRRNKSIN